MQQRFSQLRWKILERAQWLWDDKLTELKRPTCKFVNKSAARQQIEKAEAAQERQDLPGMRDAINKAWELLPPDKLKTAREQAAQSGLRGT